MADDNNTATRRHSHAACCQTAAAYNLTLPMHSNPYSIRYWPTWAGLATLWCLSHLPFGWQLSIGRLIGMTFYHLARKRRSIAATNIALCFPDLSDDARARITHESFIAMGTSVMEMAMSWWAPAPRS